MTEAKKVPAKKKAKEKEMTLWETFTKGILKENGIFVMVLGLCPALAVTSTFEGAFGMGILVMLVLTFTNTTVSSIRKVVPNTVRIPVYVIIIATEVTILKMLVDAFAPALAQELGVFIALITVNCVVFGRAEAFASKNTVGKSALDGFGVAVGFALSLSIIGFFREFLGTGMITLGKSLPLGFEYTLLQNAGLGKYAFSVLVDPPGAFLVIGIILAGITAYRQKKGAKK
ncbi:electron transport complex subunit RsxE [Peloplasma aerotolerans]|jgi:Na+-translocating ferredoxin:NAD+ oxidoreductase subunit E|uniref:Ion-translocating oxidoreductase complex subunit E n=1 Tax=Peloplasma aerotolerans TaxID=3044389 RepID=A0AAW6U609_9MOLU|nr:electron transport complex subunit RsxE [Mariniplasma sp. M4Ah]MDI6452240.1 electron transport complex subunit RsxE [Mariniplasma sp. M4Ah]MDR4968819.1 electron transport complex subunit RsxE [Acholeplasmataceae bacterium]